MKDMGNEVLHLGGYRPQHPHLRANIGHANTARLDAQIEKTRQDFARIIEKCENLMAIGDCRMALGYIMNADRSLQKAGALTKRAGRSPQVALHSEVSRIMVALRTFRSCIRTSFTPPSALTLVNRRKAEDLHT